MNGFSQKTSLDDFNRLLCGSLDASDRARLRSEMNDEKSDLRIVVDGLRELPTSFLSVVLAERGAEGEEQWAWSEEGVRQEIEAIVQKHLDEDVPPKELDNRGIVDDVYGRLLSDRSIDAPARRQFYESAAQALARAMAHIAETRSRHGVSPVVEGEDRSAGDTVASTTTRIVDSLAHPERVLARDARLRQLREADATLATVYSLWAFAGRTHDEVAELVGMRPAKVHEALELSQVEVCLDD